jgi:hypothetical protein
LAAPSLKYQIQMVFQLIADTAEAGGRDYFGEKAVLSLEKCIVKCYNM